MGPCPPRKAGDMMPGMDMGATAPGRTVWGFDAWALIIAMWWIMMVAMTLRFAAQPAVIVHLAPLLTDRGMTPVQAGGTVGLLSLVSIPSRVAAGWLGDRFPKRYVMLWLMALDVLALFVLLLATEIWHLYVFVVLFGSGYGAGILNWAMLGEYYGRARFATLRGVMGLFYTWGGVLGPVFAG